VCVVVVVLVSACELCVLQNWMDTYTREACGAAAAAAANPENETSAVCVWFCGAAPTSRGVRTTPMHGGGGYQPRVGWQGCGGWHRAPNVHR
jgi:hypothetical protein